MKFYSYFLIFLLSFTRCFGLTSPEVMRHERTINLYCSYIEKQYYGEGKISSPYCVLACVVKEKITREMDSELSRGTTPCASIQQDLSIPASTRNTPDLTNSVYSFLSDASSERKNGICVEKGVLKAVFGNCTAGVDLMGLAFFAFKKLQGFAKKTRVEKEFVAKYNGWEQKDFGSAALEIVKKGSRSGEIVLSPEEQEAILSEYHLYQFDGFRSYIKTFPQYESFMEQLHNRVNSDNKRYEDRWWKRYPGFFYETFPDVVWLLHREVKQAKEVRAKQLQAAREYQVRAIQARHTLIQQQVQHYVEYMRASAEDYLFVVESGECDSRAQMDRFAQRYQAIIQSEDNHYHISTQEYEISPQLDGFLQDHNINTDIFRQCEGSIIQHHLHQEIIMILDQTATISIEYGQVQDPSIPFFTDTIGDMAAVSAEYNHAGHVQQTLLLTDFCWGLLDCAVGIAQGACDGLYMTFDAMMDPFGTVANAASNVGHLLANAIWYSGRALYEVCDVAVACAIDRKAGVERIKQTASNVGNVVVSLADKIQKVPPKTFARDGTALVVDALVTKKCLGAMQKFYTTVQKELTAIIEVAERTGKVPAVAGACGVVVAEGAAETTRLFKQADDVKRVVEHAVGDVADYIAQFPPAKLPRKVDYVISNGKELLGLFTHFKDELKIGSVYDAFVGFRDVKITPKFLKHIFGIEITQEVTQSGIIKTMVQGFHHDLGNKMISLIKNPVIENATGVVAGALEYLGKVKPKTFFPASWSRKKVLEKIGESLLHPTEIPILDRGRWVYFGLTSEGIKIKTVFERTGELVTAYPVFKP